MDDPLVGVLAAAVPVAFLNPSLGFKKKRSAMENNSELEKFEELSHQFEQLSSSVFSAISKFKEDSHSKEINWK